MTDRIFHDADGEEVAYDGSPLSWRVSAYVVVKNDGKLLIIKNKLEKLYDIPGGGIEFEETIEEALQREALEEAGAEVTLGKLLHAEVDWFYHRKGQFYQTVQLFYTAELAGELKEPTESAIERVFWASLSELDNYPLPTTVKKVITRYLDELQ